MDYLNTDDDTQKRGAADIKSNVPRKFKIPQKGRIRFALIMALLIVALVKLADRRDYNENHPKQNQEQNSKRNQEQREMSFDDVSRLVKEYSIGASASKWAIVVENTGTKWGWGKSKIGDTLSVSLSIDTALQKYAISMFKRYKPRYAAAAAIDPATGRVLALASYANSGEKMDGSDLYVRSVFPAASVFKTVVAATGIEKAGMSSKTTVPHYGGNHTLYKTQLQRELKVSREVTLQDAYAYSYNPVFARIALFNTSKDVIAEYGRRFGFNEAPPFEIGVDISEMAEPDSDVSVAEFASGFNRKTSITPLFGALLAGAICEEGIIYAPTIVDDVKTLGGAHIYTRKSAIWKRPIKEHTALELRWMMSKVTHYGTARTAFRPLRDSPKYGKYEFGGKTGSVNKLGLGKVDWFVGFARNPNNKDQRIAIGVVTTHGEYWTVHSSYIAAELFKRYINTQSQSR